MERIIINRILNYFTKAELALYFGSLTLIIGSFLIFDGNGWLNLLSSLIGITSLILAAKGNPISQVLIIIFSIIYGLISFNFKYYGEMMTYVGMTLPMAVIALVSWLKNPFKGNKSEVEVNRVKKKEYLFMAVLTLAVTAVFYFILRSFNTANLIPSTLSVTTSFAAVYLTFRRSAFFALAYALNDIVLIVLWGLAAISNISYISVVICFVTFLLNDIYSFISWRRMEKRQRMSKI